MRLQYDAHSSTLYDATTGAAVAVLYDDTPAAERHALGRLFAAAEGMREALKAHVKTEAASDKSWEVFFELDRKAMDLTEAALRATEPPA